MVLAGGRRGPRARVRRALGAGRRPLPRARVGDVVRRRQAEHRLELRPPVAGAPADGGGLPRRGRRAPGADLRRALGAVTRLAERSSSSASSPATGSRSTCRCRRRRRSPRTRARTSAPSRCRSSPASRRRPSPSGSSTPRPRSRSRRSTSLRRGREVPMLETLEEARREAPALEHVVLAPCDELLADCPGALDPLAVDSEHPYLLTYTSGTTGQPEGRPPRPGRVPRLDRARGLLPGGRTSGRRHPLRHRHGLDHGPLDGGRRRRDGRDDRLRGRRAGLAGRPALAAGRGGARHDPRLLADADPRADPPRRAGGTTSRRCAPSSRPGEPWNPDPYRWLFEQVGGGRCPIINCSGGTEVGACFLSPHAGDADQGVLRRRARLRAWRWTSSTTRAARSSAPARSASSSAASRSRA